MAEKTGIAWTRSTFNPWIGCTKVSPGCDHCYAEALDKRHRWGGAEHWGAGVPRHRTSEHLWKQPRIWNARAKLEQESGARWGGKVGFWPVFCASLADVFDNEVPDQWRSDLFMLIDATPNLTWLLLTKRIGNAAGMIDRALNTRGGMLLNVWLGASVVNQAEANRDIPKLLQTPAVKRFVSYEPALGPVDFTNVFPDHTGQLNAFTGEASHLLGMRDRTLGKLDWIIVGGESNQGKHLARRFEYEWAYSTLRQCRAAGAAFFMKQTGSDPEALYERTQKDRAGADPAEWPEDLRVQEFPGA